MAVKAATAAGTLAAADIVDAIGYVTKMKKDFGIPIVASNNSYGFLVFSQLMQDAVDAQVLQGIVFVAAAGNAGTDNDLTPNYPSGFPSAGIVSVAATDKDDTLAAFSQYGETTVDIAAPGVDILSTMIVPTEGTMSNIRGYGVSDGTSMAAPHVAGAIAVIRGLDRTLTVDQAINIIYSGVDIKAGLADQVVTNGRLNLANSLALMRYGQIRGTVWNDNLLANARREHAGTWAGRLDRVPRPG